LTSISIVIPAYNEEKRLPSSLDRVFAYLNAHAFRFAEVIVVDDGSTDGTAALAKERARTLPALRLLANPGNRGKGYSVRHGALDARGDWILVTDADLSSPIGELDKLIAAATEQNASIAIGSRAIDRSLVGVHQPLFREMSGRVFNLVMRVVTGLPFKDTQCGFKLFSREAAQCVFGRQRQERFGFDVEVLFIARKHGLKTVEVAVRWDNVEGTKVSAFQGVAAFGDILAIRRNEIRGHYR
jgi:glycosyltransferase involved in cell wall biosynthesis